MSESIQKRRLRQLFARIGYYGILYPFQYLSALKHGTTPKCVRKKQQRYPLLDDAGIKKELVKWYHAQTGDKLDLDAPVTFTQKVQWSKYYDRDPLRTVLSDKVAVRPWVAEKIGEKYLTPVLGVWEHFDDIDFSALPKQFALKCTHGTHCNVIVDDLDTLDREKTKKAIEGWLAINYAYNSFELHYRDIPPRIMAEEYMQNNGGDLYDYKFYCYNGEVKYIQFLSDRSAGLRVAYFDRNWKKQAFVNDHPMITEELEKPDNLEEMLSICEKLSEGFPYVRVDLYRLNDGTIRFGEMTFTPASGTQNFVPASANRLLGQPYPIKK